MIRRDAEVDSFRGLPSVPIGMASVLNKLGVLVCLADGDDRSLWTQDSWDEISSAQVSYGAYRESGIFEVLSTKLAVCSPVS